MNFLAHLQLAPDDPGMQLGGVLADLVKGPDVARLPERIRAGVKLHRVIDAATDRHPATSRAIRRMAAEWGWFTGIVLDIHFDYLLACNWSDYSREPLRQFADRMYDVLQTGVQYAPPDGQQFLNGLIRTDRLVAYGTVEGLTETLTRTARRIEKRMPTRALPLGDAVPQLLALDVELTADFRELYQDLIQLAGKSIT